MRERVDVRRRNVGVGRQIGGGVEIDRGVTSLAPARDIVVIERIDMRRRNVGI
jgi:hypothetical protein